MRTRIDETTLRSLARERIVRRLLREAAPAADAAAVEDPGILNLFSSLASEFGMSDDASQAKDTPQGLTPMGVPPGKTAVQAIAELIKASPDRGRKPSGEVVDYIGPQLGKDIKKFIESKTLVNTPFKVTNPNIVPTEWKNAVEAKSVPEIKLLNPDGSLSSEKIIPKPTAAGLYRYLYAIDTAEYGLLVTRDFLEKIDGWYDKTLTAYIDPHVEMINGWTSAGDVRKIGADVLEIVLADRTPTLMMSKLYLAGFAYENSTVGEMLLPAAIGVGTAVAVLGLLYFTGGAGLGVFGGSSSIGAGGAATIGGTSLAVPAAVPFIGGAGIMSGVTTASAAKAAGLILGASVIASYGTPVALDLAQKAWFGPYSEMRTALAKPNEGEEFLSELAYELEQTPLVDTSDEYKRDQIIEAIRMIAKPDAGSNKYKIIELLREGSGSPS